MDKVFDVVVVGNVGVDTNVYLHGRDIDFSVESNFTENLDYVGQAGGYTSRGFAQLGYRTAFVGYVGDDYSGRFIREEFARDKIDMTGLFIDPTGSGRSVNFMYQDGRRKNFYDGKAHMTLQPDLELCRSVIERTRFAHFSIPNWARELLPAARESGLTISCDIQDVKSGEDPYRQDFIDYADILFFSASSLANPEAFMETLLDARPERIVVMGMGAEGCALGIDAGISYFPAVGMEEPVIDSNGAGDGLAVGFLTSYLLENYSLEEAILRGQIAARHTCTLRASSSELITKEALEENFQAQKSLGYGRMR